MIVRGMNEVEATHEFSKMREKLLEKEASIVKPLMRQKRKGIADSCKLYSKI